MAISLDVATAQAVAGATSNTWSHTCHADAKKLIVTLSFRVATTNIAVTYAGVSMTEIPNTAQNGSTGANLRMFELSDPADGANNVSASWTTASNCEGGASSWKAGAGETIGLGTAASSNASTNNPSQAITSEAGDVVVDGLACNIPTTGPTVAGGASNLYNALATNVYGASSYKSAASSMSYSATNLNWALGAVPLRPIAAASGNFFMVMFKDWKRVAGFLPPPAYGRLLLPNGAQI